MEEGRNDIGEINEEYMRVCEEFDNKIKHRYQ
jgi:hypothetical protein